MFRNVGTARCIARQCCRNWKGRRHLSRSSKHLSSGKLQWSYSAGSSETPLIGKTIDQALEAAVEKYASRTFCVFSDENLRLTYEETRAKVNQLAAGLTAIGVDPGDRVAVLAPNISEYILLQYALARMGALLVTINPAYQVGELQHALKKVGCKVLVSLDKFKTLDYHRMITDIAPELSTSKPGELKSKNLPDLKHVVFVSPERFTGAWSFQDLMDAGESRHYKQVEELFYKLQFDDPINILFTSGTTGSPKGTVLTHHNIVNICNSSGIRLGYPDYKDSASILCPVPMFHVSGLYVGSTTTLLHGGKVVWPSAGFDATKALKASQDERVNLMSGIPTMWIDYLNHPQFDTFDLSSVHTGLVGGSQCPEELMRQMVEGFKLKALFILYGMTECTALVCGTDPKKDSMKMQMSSIGKAIDNLETKIVDQDGRVVPVGTSGELCCRGFSTMLHYWEDEEKTRETLHNDGWLYTGDTATMDEDGYTYIVGRSKDMICRGGENIFPAEIEDYLLTNEKVQSAQVVGVPDERLQEEICACILLRQGEQATEEEIVAFCKGNISHQKVPRHVIFVESFPLTPVGKVKKYVLREMAKEKLGLEDV